MPANSWPLPFIYNVRKKVPVSSQIEGTQSSLSDLLLYESKAEPGVPISDVVEVSNYIAAMGHGLERIRSGFPLSFRLIKETHQILLATGRGADKMPGEFRRSQNLGGRGCRAGRSVLAPPPGEPAGQLP